MKSKYFFINSIIFTFFGSVLVFLLLWLALWKFPLESYMDGEYAWWMQQKDYIEKNSDEREIIFLGDSRMKAAIIPEEIAQNVYNLAIGGGTAIEMYYALKTYLKNHPAPEKIFLGFGAFHYTQNECFENRTLYFHYLSPKEEKEAQEVKFNDGAPLSQREKANLLSLIRRYDIRFPNLYASAVFHSFFRRTKLNRQNYSDVAFSKGQMFFGKSEKSSALNGEAKEKSFEPLYSIRFYLDKIILICRENNIPLYIIQLPMNEASFNAVQTSGYAEQFAAFMRGIEKKYAIFVETQIPCYPSEFFGDPSHLNSLGAHRFSAEIKEKYCL